jgi:hypothetical protein
MLSGRGRRGVELVLARQGRRGRGVLNLHCGRLNVLRGMLNRLGLFH